MPIPKVHTVSNSPLYVKKIFLLNRKPAQQAIAWSTTVILYVIIFYWSRICYIGEHSKLYSPWTLKWSRLSFYHFVVGRDLTELSLSLLAILATVSLSAWYSLLVIITHIAIPPFLQDAMVSNALACFLLAPLHYSLDTSSLRIMLFHLRHHLCKAFQEADSWHLVASLLKW